ncbi:hypothetical protein CO151_00775 [bacterium CG_4_9_14_3_um_filter_65_15]|nr:MAG: hypothetical protein CO151_00775 [bacterium CG_4_9_14_3_um_filter_65_15]
MFRDPFAPLTLRQRRRRWLIRLRRALLRPVRPTRRNSSRNGPSNLVLVGVDTLRADHLGCYGYGKPTSPHLDRLGGQGTLFADVTAGAPWTLPSFASALTGMMPGLHGAYLSGPVRNMDAQPPSRLNEGVVTLAGHLRAQGYRTAAFYSNQFFAFGLAESFDHRVYLNDEAQSVVAAAQDWIRRNGDRPFFCFILLNDPHEPTTPRPRDLEPFLPAVAAQGADTSIAMLRALARWGEGPAPDLGKAADITSPEIQAALAVKLAIYDASIHQVDRAVGELEDQLVRWDLGDVTLRAVFSDHGEEFLDHWEYARSCDHDPRGICGIGHGHSLFKEVLRVPWLAWGPGVPTGVRRQEPVSLLDLAPTLLDWLGLPTLPAHRGLPGDMAPLLTGHGLARPASPDPDRVVLSEALAYGPDLVAVRRGRWKLVARRDGRPLALFDLKSDAQELRDVGNREPEVLAELTAIAKRWRDTGWGATGEEGGNSWNDVDGEVLQRLKDLGYAE